MKYLLAGAAFLIGLCLAVLLITSACNADGYAVYSGKAIFDREVDYADFKIALASPEVEITDLGVLHSDPPIIVAFGVSVPLDRDFAYGDRDVSDHENNIANKWIGGIFSFIMLSVGLPLFILQVSI